MTISDEYTQGHLVLPRSLFQNFSQIFSSSQDFLVWMYFYLDRDLAPSDLAARLGTTLAKVNKSLKSLEEQGNLRLEMANGDAAFDVTPAFQKLDALLGASIQTAAVPGAVLKDLTEAFEAEIGTISPIQMEELRAWLDDDKFEPSLIKAALREASLNQKLSLSYIKAILRNWRGKGIRTVAEAQAQREERDSKNSSAASQFYIPLEGPWNDK